MRDMNAAAPSLCQKSDFQDLLKTGMNGVRTRTMKIIKSYNFMRAPRLRASPRQQRGSAVFANMLTGTDPLRGRPVGGSGVYHK